MIPDIVLYMLGGLYYLVVLLVTFGVWVEGDLEFKIALPFWLGAISIGAWIYLFVNSEPTYTIHETYTSNVHVIEDENSVSHYIRKSNGEMIKLDVNLKEPEKHKGFFEVKSENSRYGIFNVDLQHSLWYDVRKIEE